MAGGRPKRGEVQVTRKKLKTGKLGLPIVGCTLSEDVYQRLEKFRADNFDVSRATIIQKAIEEFLDREAPVRKNR